MRITGSASLGYAHSTNLPILHRKEAFVAADSPLHDRFARLTRQEVAHGLLDEPAAIGNRRGWEERLQKAGLALKGHRVVRRRDGAR